MWHGVVGQRRFLVVCVAVDAKRTHVVVVVVPSRRRLLHRAAASVFPLQPPTLLTSASFFGPVLHVLAEKTYSADSSKLTQCRKPTITQITIFIGKCLDSFHYLLQPILTFTAKKHHAATTTELNQPRPLPITNIIRNFHSDNFEYSLFSARGRRQ